MHLVVFCLFAWLIKLLSQSVLARCKSQLRSHSISKRESIHRDIVFRKQACSIARVTCSYVVGQIVNTNMRAASS